MAILIVCAIALAIPASAGAAGELDADFGVAGRSALPANIGANPVRAVATPEGGAIIATASGSILPFDIAIGASAGSVVKVGPDGKLVSGFGSGGSFSFSKGSVPLDVDLLPDGSVVVVDYSGTITLLSSTGQLVPGFGSGGKLAVPGVRAKNAVVTESGSIVVSGCMPEGDQCKGVKVRRLDEAGSIDPLFATEDLSQLQALGVGGGILERGPGGLIYLGLGPTPGPNSALTRLRADGNVDTGFGKNGIVQVPIHLGCCGAQGPVKAIAVAPDGRLGVVTWGFECGSRGSCGYTRNLVLIDATGNQQLPTAAWYEPADVAFVGGRWLYGSPWSLGVGGIDSAGKFDSGFGIAGRATGAVGSSSSAEIVLGTGDDRILAVGYACSGRKPCRLALAKYLNGVGRPQPHPRFSPAPADFRYDRRISFTGVASPVNDIASVSVAIRRKAKGMTRGTCTWVLVRGKKLVYRTARGAACSKPRWNLARGTSSWRLKIPQKLRTGDYRVYARARQKSTGLINPLLDDSDSFGSFRM